MKKKGISNSINHHLIDVFVHARDLGHCTLLTDTNILRVSCQDLMMTQSFFVQVWNISQIVQLFEFKGLVQTRPKINSHISKYHVKR